MKRVYVNEDWCLGCHLCEYYCGLSNSGMADMVKAFSGEKKPLPRIRIEEGDGINFAVQCRHCESPFCVICFSSIAACIRSAKLTGSPSSLPEILEHLHYDHSFGVSF